MIEDFIPVYPSLSNKQPIDTVLNHYLEFYENRYVNDPQRLSSSTFFPHQENTGRFLSHYTRYSSLLLIHEMGTGKSGSAVSAFDALATSNDNIQMIYLSTNKTNLENFKNEFMKRSKVLEYFFQERFHEKPVPFSDVKWRYRRDWILDKKIHFKAATFFTFAKGLIRKPFTVSSPSTLYFIVLDEAHHLTLNEDLRSDIEDALPEIEDESVNVYKTIHDWLHQLKRKKVLVMSGTPMKDRPEEIAPLLNLVVDVPFPTGKEFIDTYFQITKLSLDISFGKHIFTEYKWKPHQEEHFLTKIQGRVSYLRQESSTIDIQYVGQIIPPMKEFVLYPQILHSDSFQSQAYEKAFQLDRTSVKSLFSNSVQASLLVFPEIRLSEKTRTSLPPFSEFPKIFLSRWGSDGFKHNIIAENLRFRNTLEQCTRWSRTYSITQKIQLLQQFSKTYASIIQHIIEHPRQLVFIYGDLVQGSGILALTAFLQNWFGFTLLRSSSQYNDKPQPRMIVLNNAIVSTDLEISELIEIFNAPKNKHGDYVRIVIGSSKTKEGISLKNIGQIHILTPDWNFSATAQALARGIRALSHQDLIQENPLEKPSIRIFLHTVIPISITTPHLETSIDYYRYYVSELKDRDMKLIEYAARAASWDCPLTYDRNYNPLAIDNSRACLYRPCKYTCLGNPSSDPTKILTTTFDAYYLDEWISVAIPQFQTWIITTHRYVFHFQEVFHYFQLLYSWINMYQVQRLLFILQETPVPILDHLGFAKWLCSQHDYYYLGQTPLTTPWDPYYERHHILPFTPEYAHTCHIISCSFLQQHISLLFQQWPTNPNMIQQYLFEWLPVSVHVLLFETMMCWFQNHEKTCPKIRFDFLLWWINVLESKQLVFLRMGTSHKLNRINSHLLFGSSNYRFYHPTTNTWTWTSSIITAPDDDSSSGEEEILQIHYVGPPKKDNDTESEISFDLFQDLDKETQEFKSRFIDNNTVGFYGILDSKGELLIRTIFDKDRAVFATDKTMRTSGMKCTSYTLADMVAFLWLLGYSFPSVVDPAWSSLIQQLWTNISNMQTVSTHNLKFTKKKTQIVQFFQRHGLSQPDFNDLSTFKTFLWLSSLRKQDLCPMLRIQFEQKQLLMK